VRVQKAVLKVGDVLRIGNVDVTLAAT
jgi:hypothetical protein